MGLGITMFATLSGCALEADDPQWDNADEIVGEAAQALTTSQLTTNMGAMTGPTNGKKMVYGANAFHAVLNYPTAAGSTVTYERSADGVNWYGSYSVSAENAVNPAVAVTSTGVVGVVYIKNASNGIGEVWFRRRNPTGSGYWEPAILVAGDGSAQGGRTPAIVAVGNHMHIVWERNNEIRYVSLNVSSYASTAVTSAMVNGTTSAIRSLPTIMAGPGLNNSQNVRVAWYELRPPVNGIRTTYVMAADQTPSGALQTPTIVSSFDTTATFTAVSLAADADPTTGDAYILGSYIANSAKTTRIWRNNMPSGSTAHMMHLFSSANAFAGDIIARSDSCESKLRIAYSGTTYPNPGYYITGTWSTGPSPTWQHAAVGMGNYITVQSAMLQLVPTGNPLQMRDVVASYQQPVSNFYEMVAAHEIVPTPGLCDPGNGGSN